MCLRAASSRQKRLRLALVPIVRYVNSVPVVVESAGDDAVDAVQSAWPLLTLGSWQGLLPAQPLSRPFARRKRRSRTRVRAGRHQPVCSAPPRRALSRSFSLSLTAAAAAPRRTKTNRARRSIARTGSKIKAAGGHRRRLARTFFPSPEVTQGGREKRGGNELGDWRAGNGKKTHDGGKRLESLCYLSEWSKIYINYKLIKPVNYWHAIIRVQSGVIL